MANNQQNNPNQKQDPKNNPAQKNDWKKSQDSQRQDADRDVREKTNMR